jgi:imidazolonepropionase-like amidohydrolase
MHWDTGSLEVGKSADFIVVDRDILALADSGKADEIMQTQVLKTWLKGRVVYVPKAGHGRTVLRCHDRAGAGGARPS